VFASQRALRSDGTYFFVGGSAGIIFQVLLFGPSIRKRTGKNVRMLTVPQSRKDLLAITALIQVGQITPVIDRRYPLSEIREAMRYVSRRARPG
jgi:NADPH:quinone reductase-like Zn-dependent oxidoreductase